MKWYSVLLLVVLMTMLLNVKDTESKKMSLEEAKKSIKNLRKTCSKKFNTPKELLDGQHNGEFPKEESLMCYMKCVLTATKSMKNDQLNWEFFGKSARVMLLEEIVPRVDHLIEVCQPQATSTDGCEQAWQFSKCTYETDPEVISRYVVHDPMINESTTNSLGYHRSCRLDHRGNIRSSMHYHTLRRRYSRQNAVCRNSRTKPQCRRV